MVKFHVRKLPFIFPVVVVLGFILWKWANGSDLADPNLDCRIGSKVFADGSSHCFTSIRKLGNRRSSERLRNLRINPFTVDEDHIAMGEMWDEWLDELEREMRFFRISDPEDK